MGKKRNAYRTFVGKKQLETPRHRWEKILKWILEKQNGMICTGFIWFRIGTSRGLL
jgi:hypothetical protein